MERWTGVGNGVYGCVSGVGGAEGRGCVEVIIDCDELLPRTVRDTVPQNQVWLFH